MNGQRIVTGRAPAAPRRRVALAAAVALTAALALALLLLAESRARAHSFNPAASDCLDDADTQGTCDGDNTPGASSDLRGTLDLSAPDSQFGLAIDFTPPEWTVAEGAGITTGSVVARLFTGETVSLAAGACNTLVQPHFTLIDASTELNDMIDYRNDAASRPNDRLIPLAQDRDANGIPDGADRYPRFLKEIPAFGGLQPIARQFSWQDVAGVTVVINFLIFDKGMGFPTIGNLNPAAGYPSFLVVDDPTRAPSASILGDFCSPLSMETLTFAHPRQNNCIGDPASCPDPLAGSGKDRRGLPAMTGGYPTQLGPATAEVYRRNPAADGTYTFATLADSERDADDDGHENPLDACPLDADPTYDPRSNGSADDPDNDGIPASCDPSPDPSPLAPAGFGEPCPTGGIYDEDQDCYGNRLDNCPLAQNGQDKDKNVIGPDNQADRDFDGIGDACDPELDQPNGHLHSPLVDFTGCLATAITIGAGGTPYDVCNYLLLPGTPPATPEPTGTPTPTPTPAGGELINGDVDCDGDVAIGDAQKIARHLIGLPVGQEDGCPEIGSDVASFFGDVDCGGAVNIGDAQKIARGLIGLTVGQEEGCPEIGEPL